MESQKKIELEAAAFRRLIKHLDENKQVQNIDLMITADFCRNCLSKWMLAEAEQRNYPLTKEDAQKWVYKMPYAQWKSEHQLPATDEQMLAFNNRKNKN